MSVPSGSTPSAAGPTLGIQPGGGSSIQGPIPPQFPGAPGASYPQAAMPFPPQTATLTPQLKAFWEQQRKEIDCVGTDPAEFKNHQLPLARIKKIMKSDEDVRMISAEAPVLFAKASEMFILELTLRAWAHSEENKRRTLQRNDIAAAITRTDIFDFLVDIVPREEKAAEGEGAAPRPQAPVPNQNPQMPGMYYMPPPQLGQPPMMPPDGVMGMPPGMQVDPSGMPPPMMYGGFPMMPGQWPPQGALPGMPPMGPPQDSVKWEGGEPKPQ